MNDLDLGDPLAHHIIEALREPILVLNFELRVVVANRSFCENFQTTPGETKGKPIYELGNGQWDIPRLRDLLEKILPERTVFDDYEVEHDFENIGTKIMRLNARRIEGETNLILLAIEDVTFGKQAELVLRESSRLAALGQLAAGVAHEINSPLAVIMGHAELLAQEESIEKARSRCAIIVSETKRVAKIVGNLLSFARQHNVRQLRVDVKPVLERAITMKSNEFKISNIGVNTQFSPDLAPIAVDPYQIIEVMLNLLTNAQHAMVEAHGGGEINISASRSEDGVIVTVNDDGPGIPPEYLTRIFEPFFSTKGVGQGTGLGLSICHGIIKQHGGSIWAESNVDRGTTFYIKLPLATSDTRALDEDPSLDPEVPQSSQIDTPATAIHVLAVDDEPLILQLLTEVLPRDGFIVDVAVDGEDALSKMEWKKYDCVILDMKMPRMNGSQFLQRLKDSNSDLLNKCVILTGATLNPEILELAASTGTPLITKPFSYDDVLSAIRRTVGGIHPQP